jgi:hypothetical protein
MAEGTKIVRPHSGFDMIIAVITNADHCTVATDNEKHSPDCQFINLMRGCLRDFRSQSTTGHSRISSAKSGNTPKRA